MHFLVSILRIMPLIRLNSFCILLNAKNIKVHRKKPLLFLKLKIQNNKWESVFRVRKRTGLGCRWIKGLYKLLWGDVFTFFIYTYIPDLRHFWLILLCYYIAKIYLKILPAVYVLKSLQRKVCHSVAWFLAVVFLLVFNK